MTRKRIPLTQLDEGARGDAGYELPERAVTDAIIFDMDGLMVDSEPLSRQIWERVLAEYGHTFHEQTYQRMVGRRTSESARIVLASYQLPVTAEELADYKSALWEKVWREEGLPPMPGLPALLNELARRRLPWAVATSSPRHYAEHVLAHLDHTENCQAIVGGDEVMNGKPAPDIYLAAAERLGVAPARCLALEDSVPGGRAAQAAGMRLAAVPGSAATPGDFDFADYCFTSLHEVRSHLDELLAAAI